jgi:hypothetical protein
MIVPANRLIPINVHGHPTRWDQRVFPRVVTFAESVKPPINPEP